MENEIKLDTKNLSKQLKFLANLEGLNMTLLKYAVNELFNKKDSVRNLYNKLKHNRLRVCELAEIAEIILRKKP